MNKNIDPEYLSKALNYRSQNDNLRKLDLPLNKIDFWSNDYLGYSKIDLDILHTETNAQIHGSSGSRLISGNSKNACELEIYLANFHGAESALMFNSGYNANVGLMSCVPQRGDLILFDELVHASLYDGIRLSNAKRFKFKHNDIANLAKLINRHVADFKNIFIVIESVYSMDGDMAPIVEIVKFKKNYPNIYLIVDEAHALGVFGEQGKGLVDSLGMNESFFARIFTFGKSLGCHGAVIVGSQILVNYLVNFSRSFIYTTALPNNSIDRIKRAYGWLEQGINFEALQGNIDYFRSHSQHQLDFIESLTPIQSLVCGSNKRANDLENWFKVHGFNVKGIKSPTVKAGSERIRFCIHSFNSKFEIDKLFDVINKNRDLKDE